MWERPHLDFFFFSSSYNSAYRIPDAALGSSTFVRGAFQGSSFINLHFVAPYFGYYCGPPANRSHKFTYIFVRIRHVIFNINGFDSKQNCHISCDEQAGEIMETPIYTEKIMINGIRYTDMIDDWSLPNVATRELETVKFPQIIDLLKLRFLFAF